MNKSSLFATLPGLLALLALAIAAAYYGASLLATVLLLAFVLCAGARLWSRMVLKRTEVSIDESAIACHAGETFEMTLRVRSRSFFPLIWLDVALPLALSDAPKVIREGDDPQKRMDLPYERPLVGLTERFVWLLWQQEIACQEQMTALSRGVTRIDRASLQAGDGLGVAACQRWTRIQSPAVITVYPRLIPVDTAPFLRMIQDAETGSRGQTEDITLLRSSRPYQHGDPMRRINWRQFAASGVMETNQYETITPGCMTFVLDLASFGYEEIINQDAATKSGGTVRKAVHVMQMERMISAVASVICELSARSQRFALIIPGYGEREAVVCRPGSGETAYMQAMETLAGIAYRGGSAQLPLDELRGMRRKLGVVHLCAYDDLRGEEERLFALGFARLRRIVCLQELNSPEDGEKDCLLLSRIAPLGGEGGAA